MRENISELAKNAVIEFRKLDDSKKLYVMGIILNHIENGLINDGNYSNSDEAYEKELQKIVDSYGYESVDALKEQVEEEELKITALNSIVVEELTKKCIQNASGK